MEEVNASFVRLKSDVKHAESNFWSNPVTYLVQTEIEMVKSNPPKVNKVMYVALAMGFGICGCDRCFMGQVALGCLKGFTLGGCLIWSTIDYFVAVASALSQEKKIDMLGYHATFKESSISSAFGVCIFFLITGIWQYYSTYSQIQLQQQQQNAMIEAIMRDAAKNQKPTTQADESLDIPTRHQSLAYIPTALTRNLRKAGLVPEKPTVPELIAAFDAMDKNKDGLLDREEIKEGMKAMGATDEAVEEMIKTADADGDGQISKNEFLVAHHANREV